MKNKNKQKKKDKKETKKNIVLVISFIPVCWYTVIKQQTL